jgi:peptide/nickel transport system substrate-binding protein
LAVPARPWLLTVAWVLFCTAGACSRAPQQARPAASRAGGELKLISQTPPETLDPHAVVYLFDAELSPLVFEGLVGHGDKPGEVRPLLAESWQYTEGGRVWSFTLRPGAWFHDDPCFPGGRGRQVNARDVVSTFERVASPKAEWPNWYLFAGKIEGMDEYHAGRATSIRGLEVVDDRRIRIRLTRPYGSFLKLLASHIAFIVPREAVSAYGAEFGRHPVGTGPFRLARWRSIDQILFVRNSRYWAKDEQGVSLPYLASIDLRFRADATESGLLGAFLKGETHLFTAQEQIYRNLTAGGETRRGVRLAGVLPGMSLRFLGFSLDNGSVLARRPELRRAVAMAFDRSRLGRSAAPSQVQLAETLAPPLFLKSPAQWHAYAPELARAILAQHAKEINASPPVLASNFASDDLTLLRQDLARLGISASIRIRPGGYYPYLVKDRPDLFRVSFTPSFYDPEDYYSLFSSKSSAEVNLTGYRNAEYDRVLESAIAELDERKRIALFMRLEEILRQDVPAIYLSRGAPAYVLTSAELHGVVVRLYHQDYTSAWLTNSGTGAHATEPAN